MADPSVFDPSHVEIYDTTLRDGTQMEGLSLSVNDKLRIARRLDAFGVAYIEAGWPGSNPKDREVFARLRDMEFKHAKVAAFGSTRRAQVAPEDDPGLRLLLEAETPVCTIFGKSSKLHVEQVLRTTCDENLRMIEDSVRFLVSNGRRVFFDAEHFFDGHRLDAVYATETLLAAKRGGAEVLVLCDTNGGTMPWVVHFTVADVARLIDRRLGIHTHDDAGMGVANSVSAVEAGVRHVQCTINGYGERCGNANMCAIVPTLELKLGLSAVPEGHLGQLYELSHFAAEVANLAPNEHQAYVGRSAFAHKGGVHAAAIRRTESSYTHVDPSRIGNATRVVVSELAGRGSLRTKADEYGIALPDGEDEQVLESIKTLEAGGASFEEAEASVELMLRRREPGYVAPFSLVDYHVMVGHRGSGTFAEAMVKIRVDGQVLHTAAEGEGPVGALDEALRKALEAAYPGVRRIQLADFKVRILDERAGTGATTRVIIDHREGTRTWSTVGASSNVIEASWTALADGIEYGLVTASVQRLSELPAR